MTVSAATEQRYRQPGDAVPVLARKPGIGLLAVVALLGSAVAAGDGRAQADSEATKPGSVSPGSVSPGSVSPGSVSPGPGVSAESPSGDDVQALIAAMQARLDTLNDASAAAGAALERLDTSLDQAIGRMSSRQEENAGLRNRTDQLQTRVDDLTALRAGLAAALSQTEQERAAIEARMQSRIDLLAEQLNAERESAAALAARARELSALLTAAQAEQADLGQTLVRVRADLTRSTDRTATLTDTLARRDQALQQTRKDLDESRAGLAVLTEKLATAETAAAARISTLQGALLTARHDLASTRDQLAETRSAQTDSEDRLALLTAQIGALRDQLAQLNAALAASEQANAAQEVTIVNLGRRLNEALASRVSELAGYRSEFFGRLRQVLGDRGDIRVVGDRFVIQAEVLFASGSAELGPEGQSRLLGLARGLNQIAVSIPPDIDWVLRVDGHTDRRPIATAAFPSNWALSSARALSVVRFLTANGVPPERLVAAGFGEFHPLDPGEGETAWRRNRRIEFKLTQP